MPAKVSNLHPCSNNQYLLSTQFTLYAFVTHHLEIFLMHDLHICVKTLCTISGINQQVKFQDVANSYFPACTRSLRDSFLSPALTLHKLKIDLRRSHLSLHEAERFQNATWLCKSTLCEERPCTGQVGQIETEQTLSCANSFLLPDTLA